MAYYSLSPSKAHRYLYCSASLLHDQPFVDTPITIRGKLLHQISELLIKGVDCDEIIKENNLNDYEIKLVTKYSELILNQIDSLQPDIFSVEVKQKINIFDTNINLIMDTLLINTRSGISYIYDLKTGNNDVEVKDNEQLLFYALAVLLNYKDIGIIKVSIFQKMKNKELTLYPNEVYDFFIDKEDVFNKIKKNELEYHPSEKACKYCAFKNKCVARANWILEGKKNDS